MDPQAAVRRAAVCLLPVDLQVDLQVENRAEVCHLPVVLQMVPWAVRQVAPWAVRQVALWVVRLVAAPRAARSVEWKAWKVSAFQAVAAPAVKATANVMVAVLPAVASGAVWTAKMAVVVPAVSGNSPAEEILNRQNN